MRGVFILFGAGLFVTGLTGAVVNVTGVFMPWLWVAFAGFLVTVVAWVATVGFGGPDDPNGVGSLDLAEQAHRGPR